MRLRWIELAASVWLLAAPFVIGYLGMAYWNQLMIGLLAGTITLVGWREERVWWALLPFGAWLVVAPALLGYSGVTAAVWTDVTVGLVFITGAVVRARRWYTGRARRP